MDAINRKVVILFLLVVLLGTTEAFLAKGTQAAEATSLANAVNLKGHLFFFFEQELWKSDGTEAGTTMIKNLASNPDCTVHSLTEVNSTMFFVVANGKTGTELWKSDGSEAGTRLVRAIKTLPRHSLII
jgi:ELWxxDGT repeat protein